tara:strand:+ start:70 stop:609 length:540 start_codon:yes stop_codon:yes gene_type:complete
MKMNNWITNANKVRAWAEHQPPSDNLQAVMLSLTLGENAGSDDLRSTYWTAIRSIGSTMESFPAARRGRESTLTEGQEAVFMDVEAKVLNAFAQIPTEYHELLLAVIVPHGRTGGVFADYSELVSNQVRQAHNYMTASVKENRWNGEKIDKQGVPVIIDRPVPTKDPKDTKTSEGEEEE